MNTQEEKKAPAVIERHMRIPLAVLNAVEATKVYFTDDAEHRERQTLPEVELSDTERTPRRLHRAGLGAPRDTESTARQVAPCLSRTTEHMARADAPAGHCCCRYA